MRGVGKKLLRGVGINDADYETQHYEWVPCEITGVLKKKRVWYCPYYRRWCSMLARCYSKVVHLDRSSYKGVTVCEDWLTFSNFKNWMEKQEWEGKHLDKDILSRNNRIYCEAYCVFVHGKVNTFLLDGKKGRGDYLLGVSIHPRKTLPDNYRAGVNNPFTGGRDYLGLFPTEVEAHLAWKEGKHRYSCALANSEFVTDERVRQALLVRYNQLDKIEE